MPSYCFSFQWRVTRRPTCQLRSTCPSATCCSFPSVQASKDLKIYGDQDEEHDLTDGHGNVRIEARDAIGDRVLTSRSYRSSTRSRAVRASKCLLLEFRLSERSFRSKSELFGDYYIGVNRDCFVHGSERGPLGVASAGSLLHIYPKQKLAKEVTKIRYFPTVKPG